MKPYEMLVALAADQHGLFRAQEAVDADIPRSTINRLVSDGRIERLAHGLYRVTALPQDRLTPYMEAVLWANGQGVISRASALEAQELCDLIPRRIHVTVPADYNPRKAGGDDYRVHRRSYTDRDITYHEGIPVARTYLAISEAHRDGEDPEQLRLAIRNAVDRGLLLQAEANELEMRIR